MGAVALVGMGLTIGGVFANQVPQNGVVYAVLYPPLMSDTPIWYIEQKVLESHFVNIIEITIQAIQQLGG